MVKSSLPPSFSDDEIGAMFELGHARRAETHDKLPLLFKPGEGIEDVVDLEDKMADPFEEIGYAAEDVDAATPVPPEEGEEDVGGDWGDEDAED